MLHFLPVFLMVGLALTLVAILVERGFWQSTWAQSTIQSGRDLLLLHGMDVQPDHFHSVTWRVSPRDGLSLYGRYR